MKYGIYTSYGMEKGNLAELLLFYSAKQQKKNNVIHTLHFPPFFCATVNFIVVWKILADMAEF